MSQNTLNRVWKRSKVGGTTLLLVLALADVADDWGYCYPSLTMLARKARQDKKSVIQMLQKLERLGEIRRLSLERVDVNGSTRTNAFYQVISGMSKEHIAFSEKVSPLYRRMTGKAERIDTIPIPNL